MNEFESYNRPEENGAEPTPVEQQPAAENTTYHYTAPQYGTWQSEPRPEPVKKKKEKKKRTGLKIAAIALSCSLLGAILGAAGVVAADRFLYRTPVGTSNILQGSSPHTKIEVVEVEKDKLLTEAEVYAANVNSTVGITTSVTVNFWGYQSQSAASGSGFIITEDGYILTNHHVIEDSDSITVTLYNGTQYEAKLVGSDASNDVAVLKVEATGLTPVVLGDSDKLNVGDPVVAIGNPLGELTFSLTSGAVSALNRSVTFSGGLTMELIQTDCAINSGNSGGALFNLYGEVIGITNAKYSSSSSGASIDNIGFAIPINDVMSIVESIIEKGYISKPYIGVSVTSVSEDAQAYGVPAGAAIQEVTKGSPADKAGLQAGDIVTAVNGTAVTGGTELVDVVGKGKVGDTIELDVYRKGETLKISVTTEEHIQSTEPAEQQPQQQMPQQQLPQQNPSMPSLPWPWSEFFGGMF